MSNMNCSGQKANSKEWNQNFDRVFNQRPFFDVINDIDEILEEANTCNLGCCEGADCDIPEEQAPCATPNKED